MVEIGRAAAAAQRVSELPLDAAQRAELDTARSELAVRLRRRIAWLAERAAQARVVEERADWRALAAVDAPGLAAVVRDEFAARGWRLPVAAGPDLDPVDVGVPLQRGAVVRCRNGSIDSAGFAEGRVVAVRGDRVTVKIDDSEGLRFPSVDLLDCEPISVDGTSAAAWARHAHRRGAVGLALAWAVAANSRADRPLEGSAREELWRELAGR